GTEYWSSANRTAEQLSLGGEQVVRKLMEEQITNNINGSPSKQQGWMHDMMTSTFVHVRRRALSMTVHDVYNFYKIRILDQYELEILEESSQQVVNGGNQLASLIQERQSVELLLEKGLDQLAELSHLEEIYFSGWISRPAHLEAEW
ncbi:hypothetical protein BGX27_005699, partial [Mortierella sp. AM989]